ncbi:MAG: hypothetical protein GF370_03985 [Candidatus Nealsonbacteria bacterium]|nr:hypothetical protein [Candidatus Nealsonbacteria bacterium]
MKKVSQESEPFNNFTREERSVRISGRSEIIGKPGTVLPWLGAFGACLVKVYGIRHDNKGEVEFGIGNEEPPILGWVKKEDFYHKWPD